MNQTRFPTKHPGHSGTEKQVATSDHDLPQWSLQRWRTLVAWVRWRGVGARGPSAADTRSWRCERRQPNVTVAVVADGESRALRADGTSTRLHAEARLLACSIVLPERVAQSWMPKCGGFALLQRCPPYSVPLCICSSLDILTKCLPQTAQQHTPSHQEFMSPH